MRALYKNNTSALFPGSSCICFKLHIHYFHTRFCTCSLQALLYPSTMRTAFLTSALVGLAAAAPRPQDINIDDVLGAPNVTTGPSPTEVDQPISYDAQAAAASASAAVVADLSSSTKVKRTPGDCAPQPDGYGPKPATDTVDAFLNFQTFAVCEPPFNRLTHTYRFHRISPPTHQPHRATSGPS